MRLSAKSVGIITVIKKRRAGEVAQLVRLEIDDAEVIVEVEGCDLLITVISPQFTVLALVKKQQLVISTLKDPLASGKLHAVSVKAYTP